MAQCAAIIHGQKESISQEFAGALSQLSKHSYADSAIDEFAERTSKGLAVKLAEALVVGAQAALISEGGRADDVECRDFVAKDGKRDADVGESGNVSLELRVQKLVADFEMGIEVEAALLRLDVDSLSELLASETDLRRKLHGMADSDERMQKTMWLVSMIGCSSAACSTSSSLA